MKTKHTPGPWHMRSMLHPERMKLARIDIDIINSDNSAGIAYLAIGGEAAGREMHESEYQANARLLAAAPDLLAYAECEEARRLSLLPTSKGGTGNSQSYLEVFSRHGFVGGTVFDFLDGLRRAAIVKATGETP